MDVATIKGWLTGCGAWAGFAEPLASDKRRLILTPTPQGKALYRKLVSRAREVSQQTLSPLSEAESQQLMVLLRK